MLKCGRRSLNLEIVLYFAVYIIYLLFGLWALFRVRNDILQVAQFEFSRGWSVVGRPRDDSNDELENFTTFLRDNWVWYLLHAVISLAVRNRWRRGQYIGHAAVGISALIYCLPLASVGVLIVLLLSYYGASRSDSKSLVWLLSALWMLVINFIKNSNDWYLTLGYTSYFTSIVTLSWSLLRCCSYSLNRINDKANGVIGYEATYSAEHYLGYTLYFPSLIYGPFIGFRRYVVPLQSNQSPLGLPARSLSLVWELMRVAFWWCVLQLALHFFYVHYMARDVSAVQLVLPSFGRHAIGYFMGQFFFLYYVVTYGLGIAFANFDGLDPPNRPRCIGCIHFYSDMWKKFDEGLYEFLFRHIYAELCGRRSRIWSKLFATAATFAFVFVWHGCYMYVLIWSALNFGCLVAEKCFKAMLEAPVYVRCVTRCLGESGALRLRALLATQLFIPAAFANVYFISGQEVGDFLMRGAYMNGIANYVALTLCSYCFFQCSEMILTIKKSDSKHISYTQANGNKNNTKLYFGSFY